MARKYWRRLCLHLAAGSSLVRRHQGIKLSLVCSGWGAASATSTASEEAAAAAPAPPPSPPTTPARLKSWRGSGRVGVLGARRRRKSGGVVRGAWANRRRSVEGAAATPLRSNCSSWRRWRGGSVHGGSYWGSRGRRSSGGLVTNDADTDDRVVDLAAVEFGNGRLCSRTRTV